jgi:hypothetical protein
MSANQTTAARVAPARRAVSRRVGRLLEENGPLVMVVAAFGLVMLLALRNALTIDGWMALASGREIAQHGLPTHDALAVWTHGQRWIDQQWLAQLLLYRLWQAGGIKLALLIHALLATAALAGAATAARRLGGSARTTTWVCLPVMAAYYPEAGVLRPQTFAYPLFVAVFALLALDARKRSRRVFLVLPLLVLWANLHGSVILGAGFVTAAAALRTAELLKLGDRAAAACSIALAGGALLSVLASPYALHLPSYYDTILAGGNLSHFVTEWAPTTLTASTAAVYLLILAGVWLIGRTGPRITGFEKVAFLGAALLAFDAVRNTAWLGLTALVVLPVLIDGLRRPVEEPRRLNRMLATVLICGVGVGFFGVAAKPNDWFTAGFPSAAGNATVAAAQGGDVFATSRYADWLLWTQPVLRGRVAFDARYELLSSAQVKRLADVQDARGMWQRTLAGDRVVLLDRRDDATLHDALAATHAFRTVVRTGNVIVLARTAK